VELGAPSVNYRETITQKKNFNFLHKKQSGGAGQFARVIGYLEPLDPENPANKECKFVNATVGTNVPSEYINAIEKEFYKVIKKGPMTGYEVYNTKYVLTDGQTHVVDSSSMAFATATRGSFREAFKEAGASILEPVMKVDVTVPMEYNSATMVGITKRRGSITNTETRDGNFLINAEVPLGMMFGYATEIRGQTQGQGEYSMEYLEHRPVMPGEIQGIIEEHQRKLAAENE